MTPPRAPQSDLNPITINNFTPGISDNPSANYPLGTAQRTNTYRCFSPQSGALQPLFQPSTAYPGVDWGTPSPSEFYTVEGFFIAGPVLPTAATGSSRVHELWLATGFHTATTAREHRLERLLVDETPISRETIKSVSHTDSSSAGDLLFWGMTFGTTRSHQASPNTPGIPVVIAAWAPALDATDGYVIEFPNDTTPTSNTPYVILADTQSLVTCHQNRVVMRRNTINSHGVDTVWNFTEDLYWTEANDVTTANIVGPQSFVPEQPDGYSVVASMSARELFLLKQSGAVVLAGDLDDPTVLNLPMVAGAGTGGAYTQKGFMYGSNSSGLWSWAHGDSSTNVSPLMLPDFYKLNSSGLVANQYTWDAVDNFVFLSNNFMHDTDTGAFWRLEDTDTALYRFMGHKLNYLYGCMSTYTDADLTVIHSWDMTVPASSFSWQSQPLWVTLDRTFDIRDIGIRASSPADGTVTVTVIADNGSSVSQTFDISANAAPSFQHQKKGLKGRSLTVLIESTATTPGDPAPSVYEVTLQPSERHGIGQVT